ncbi:hypothetical protein BN136_2787 [Cronobacter universalis NCTC 9529]|nr:hypothetical protein BN130_3040 [Cronobacter malonaticus 507]CCK16777.1 hypothetical protein BN136_2787 [Cronobacter universalis NCTC 9529]
MLAEAPLIINIVINAAVMAFPVWRMKIILSLMSDVGVSFIHYESSY